MDVETPSGSASTVRTDTLTPPRSRRTLLWAGAAAILLLSLVCFVVGRNWYFALERGRTSKLEMETVGELQQKLAIKHQPLTHEEFDTLLSLCDGIEAETRFTALAIASADAYRHHPERKSRITPVAVKLMSDMDPKVREFAINALRSAGAREHIDLIRPSLKAENQRERQAAEKAVAVLEGVEAPK